MKFIHVDGATILTTDDVADAVSAYFDDLCRNDWADLIVIPSIDEDGMLSKTEVLIGPDNRIGLEKTDDDVLETPNPAFVAQLQTAAASLRPRRAPNNR